MGICLGMQLILSESHEDGLFNGLNWINGKVVKIPTKSDLIKIPHMGWNDVDFSSESKLFKNIATNSTFYFVHSYHVVPKDKKIATSKCFHGSDIVSSIEFENISATQFHPEKSHDPGIKLLKNFINS